MKTQEHDTPRFQRPSTIVTTYGVNERTLRRWIATGTLRSVRVGRSVYIPTEAIEALFSGPLAPVADHDTKTPS